MKFPVKNVEIVRKLSVLASSSSQTQGFDRILKIFIKSLFFIKLEVNDDKTGLLFVPLSTLSKPEGTHHPLSLIFEVIPLTIATQTITYATAAEVAAAITALADVVSNAAATAVAISDSRICTNSSHGAKQNAVWS